MPQETIGERIRLLREKHEMTRTSLSKLMHVDRRTVSRWEDGSAAPRPTDIARLAEIFAVSCDHIILGK
jgi:transcriptional regulator with XRE-family HTH domain